MEREETDVFNLKYLIRPICLVDCLFTIDLKEFLFDSLINLLLLMFLKYLLSACDCHFKNLIIYALRFNFNFVSFSFWLILLMS